MPDRDPAEEQDTSYIAPARLAGFTPVIDEVVYDLGTTAALVYGVVYRHAMMYHQQCEASQSTMAGLTGLADRTIRKWLKVLEDEGYILAIATPPGKPTVYIPTGKVKFEFKISAGWGTPDRSAGVKKVQNQTAAPGAETPEPRSDKETMKRQKNHIIWDSCLLELSLQFTRAIFAQWLYGSELLDLTDARALICVRDANAVEWCTARLATPIRRTLTDVLDDWAGDVEFVTENEEAE